MPIEADRAWFRYSNSVKKLAFRRAHDYLLREHSWAVLERRETILGMYLGVLSVKNICLSFTS